nr:MAG TPA: hypothetical protein [Caudoviricetes sp.]
MVNCICIKIVFFYCMQSETGYSDCCFLNNEV